MIIFILNGFSVQAQINRQNSLILDSTDCNFNKPIVLRAGFHFPLGIQPFVSAEVKLLKRITLNTQIGASLDYSPEEALGDLDPWEFAPTGISYFISPELRYYFRPIGRLKKNNQPLFGFSGAYLALKYFASTLSNKKNNSSRFSYENVSAWQLNIGSQLQYKRHLYAAGYAGVVLSKSSINKSLPNVIPMLQFGFTLGYVF